MSKNEEQVLKSAGSTPCRRGDRHRLTHLEEASGYLLSSTCQWCPIGLPLERGWRVRTALDTFALSAAEYAILPVGDAKAAEQRVGCSPGPGPIK